MHTGIQLLYIMSVDTDRQRQFFEYVVQDRLIYNSGVFAFYILTSSWIPWNS
jgi:hypothetical protein